MFQGRAVILNQETDLFRAHVLRWACNGPEGQDIPDDLPLNRSQVRILNERIRRAMAYKGLPMFTPVPLPPLPTSNIPPLRPARPRDSYRPITGIYDRAPPTTSTPKDSYKTTSTTTRNQRLDPPHGRYLPRPSPLKESHLPQERPSFPLAGCRHVRHHGLCLQHTQPP